MDTEKQHLYLELLTCAILQARGAAWAGDAEQAARELDHVHNLPALVAGYDPQREEYFLNVEHPAYVRASGQKACSEITQLVDQIRQLSSVVDQRPHVS